jgi:hypothetical protein
MNKILHIILISLFSLIVFSCGEKEEEKEAPVIAEVTAVTTPTSDPSPNYTFSSTKAGTITYGGSCSSGTTSATSGNNTITFLTLSDGTYSDCTIIVTDSDGNASNILAITSFIVNTTTDTTRPTVSSVSTTADNQSSVSITDNITVTFSEAMDTTYVTTSTSDTYCAGTIRVSSDNFSSCVKMSSDPINSNDNKTFTLDPYDNLTGLTTYKTRVTTGVKDTAGNAMSSQYETSFTVATDCCSSDSAIIKGTVEDNASEALSGVSVIFAKSGTTSSTVTTVDNGTYSKSTLSSGTYTLTYTKSGFVDTSLSATLTADNETLEVDTVQLLADTCASTGTISGTIKDAVSNSGVTNVSLSARSGMNTDDGTIVKTTTSDSSGNYSLSSMSTGWYTIQTSKSGYIATTFNVFACGDQSEQDGSISTTLSIGSLRIVLSWKSNVDLDAHLTGPDNASGRFHVYYRQKRFHYDNNTYSSSRSSSDNVTQDAYSVHGYEGPETITVSAVRSGTYRYYVHNYTNAGQKNHMGLYKSKASVKVYHSSLSGGFKQFKAPNKPGDLWTVFEFNSSSGLTRIRTVGSESSSANVDSHGSSVTDGIGLMGGAFQGRELSLSTAVTTLAGSSQGYTDNAIGTSASFDNPMGITTDGTNLYVADFDNNRIRKIVIDNGTVTTLAGSSSGNADNAIGTSASFNKPDGITTDGTNLYVADLDNHRIRKIVISTGVVTTLAGSSEGYTDATGTSARFFGPIGITTDGTNLYVADRYNHRIRKIVISTGVVTTLAGSSQGSTDATGTSARFNQPWGITTDGTNLYVADYKNRRIRKIVISTGVVTTLAGSSQGYTDATGTSARFYSPMGITTDATNLYVGDYANNRIRKIVISTGVVTTLAGSSGGYTDATGTSARFNQPMGITTDGTNLYVVDYGNNRIRKIE